MALSRRDTILVLLMGQPVEGMTRMQKYLFLAQQQQGDEAPDFQPYRFGPYSSKLYDDLEMLENLGLITSEPTGDLSEAEAEETELSFEYLMGDDEQEGAIAEQEAKRYALTPDGQRFVEKRIREQASDEDVEGIRRVKSRFANYSLKALLRYVYSNYPEWTTESEIRDEIL